MSLFDLLRSAIGGVDGVNRLVAAEVTARLAKYPEDYRLTTREGRAIMRDVRSIVSTAYGSTQGRSMSSPIFREITKHTDLAAEMAFQDMFAELKTSMQNVDPDLYDEFRRGMYEGGFGEEDKLAEAFMSLNGPQAERQRFLRSGLMDPQRRWVDPAGYRLSDRVWKAGQRQRKAIDRVITQGIRKGTGPVTLAGELNRYLNPDFAPVKYEPNGRVTRRNRRPSGATSARVLARTELQRVHHDATVDAVARLEVHRVGVKWALSAAHPKIDICDSYAKGSSPGFPPGVYWPDEVPSLPHPQCLCNLQPWVPSSEDVIREIADRYTGNAGTASRLTEIKNPTKADFGDVLEQPVMPFGPSPMFAPDQYARDVAQSYIDYMTDAQTWTVARHFEDAWARAGYQLNIMEDVALPQRYWGMLNMPRHDPLDLFYEMSNLTDAVNYRQSQGMWTAPMWKVWNSGSRGEDNTVAWVNKFINPYEININIRNPHWFGYDGDAFHVTPDGNWSARNSMYGSVNHEHGHLLHYFNIDSQGVWTSHNELRYTDTMGFHRWNKDPNGFLDEYERDMAKFISRYAATEPGEFVAEVYALIAEGLPVSDEVLEVYRQLWGPDVSGGLLP